MDTDGLLILLVVLGSGLLLGLIVLRRRVARRERTRPPAHITRSVVYLTVGSQLLVMQQVHTQQRRARLEVPKGKLKAGETAIDAAYRECWEESGVRPHDLRLLTVFPTRRRPGMRRWWERAAFWGTVPTGTVLPFTYRVRGNGGDRGRVYHYRLVPLATVVLHPPLDVPLPALHAVLAHVHGDGTTP
jgi:ADP-ribose pyrophosphatase YjhB (NUDIX family)